MVMKFTNNASTTLSAGITNVATSLTVQTGAGALFPTLGAGDYFYCTLANAGGNVEIVKVTARSGDTFSTIVRAQDGTTALAWNAGDKVELRLVAASLNDIPKLDEANTFSGTANTFSNAPILSSLTGYLKGNGASAVTAQAVPIPATDGGTGLTSPGTSGNVLMSNGSIWTSSSISSVAATTTISVRQTVSAGPVDSNGFPSFLPATSASLSITSQNVSSTVPFVATAANGSGSTGNVDRVGKSTANLTWSGLTGSTTNYLYVDVGADGTLTTGSTTLAPVYQFGGTRSTTSGQATFNISEMYMSVGNGSSAVQTYRVFVGEAVTNVGTVTSTVAYAYNGLYDSGWTNTLPSNATKTSKNHNIGVAPEVRALSLKCITTDNGFAVGDIIQAPSTNGAATLNNVIRTDRNSMSFTTGSATSNYWYTPNLTTGVSTQLTLANWAYKLTASRGW